MNQKLLRALYRFFEIVRRDFVAGLLALAPLGVTIWAIGWILDFFDNLLLPRILRLFGFEEAARTPFIGVLFSVVVIVLFGILVRNLLGQRMLAIWENWMTRIPVARGIYSSVKQLVETIIQTKGHEQFRRVVLVEYPRKGMYGLGFVTNRVKGLLPGRTDAELTSIFIPTTPNPTSGFYLLVPEPELIDVDLSVEEAFKLIMSAGLVSPERFTANFKPTAPPANSQPPAASDTN